MLIIYTFWWTTFVQEGIECRHKLSEEWGRSIRNDDSAIIKTELQHRYQCLNRREQKVLQIASTHC